MKIIYLELKDYIRLDLNNIKLLRYTPEKQVQVIIGTNGCGKSSLIHELSPLPADHNQYRVGGYKLIKISHNGSEYELLSDFRNGRKHSFLKDGIELNESKIITIQKELVKQHFNYDNEVHNILMGNEKFTDMSAPRRRECLIKFSTVSFDYAIWFFGKLKERLTYTSTLLKNNKKKLVEEQNKLISNDKHEEALGLKSKLIHILEQCFSIRGNVNEPITESREKINNALARIMKISTQFMNLKVRNEFDREFNSKEDIDQYATEVYADIKVIENTLQLKVSEFDKSSKLLEYISNGEKSTLEEIREKLKPIYDEISNIKANKALNIPSDQPQVAIDTIDLIEPIVTDIFSDINLEYKYSNLETLDKTSRYRDKIKTDLDELKKEYHMIINEIAHMDHQKNGQAAQCPKCRHSWVIGYSEEKYLDALDRREKQVVLIQEKENSLTEVDNALSKMKEYIFKIDRYNNLTRIYDLQLGNFWSYILQNNHLENPAIIIKLLNQYKQELYADIEVAKKEDSIVKLNELYQKLIDDNINNVEELKNQILSLEEMITQETIKLTQLKELHSSLQAYGKNVYIGTHVKESIKEMEGVIVASSKEILKSVQVDVVNKYISHYQVQLANVEKTIHQYHLQKWIIEDIEKTIKNLEHEEQCIKILIKELSPTEGLIAEGLHGFMVKFTDSLNKIINKVWTYPLEVLPCKTENEESIELDYKFPIVVNGGSPKEDVSCGSTAMKEMINLSFRLTAIKYMGFSNAWLALDEFSSSMDKAHRLSVIDLLKSLMEFSQIFIVNHFYDSYAAFNDADVCALSIMNIVLPEKYNQHIQIN